MRKTFDPALKLAVMRAREAAGGTQRLANAIGVSSQAVSQWHRCPTSRALAVERVTGISRHVLRPDVFGPAPAEGDAA